MLHICVFVYVYVYMYAGVCNCKDTYICIVSKGDLSFGANTRRGVFNGLYVVFVSPTSIT